VITWKTEKRKVADLTPAEYNPREMTKEQAKDLAKSLERFNLADPIVINSDNRIIGGHQRINIIKQKAKNDDFEVDVRVPSRKLTEHEERELNLRLNKNLGQWDFNLLANFDEDMLKDVGFDSEELDKIFQIEPEPKDDDVPEARETDIKQGDMFQLGEHRLLCGDATQREDVERLMQGEKADMVFTDPPYGMNLDTDFSSMEGIAGGNKYRKVEGDDKKFNPRPFIELFDYCKEQFWWGADYYAEMIPNRNDGCFMVWDKTEAGVRTNSNYDKQFGSNFELVWSREKHKRQIIRALWKGIFGLSKEDTKKRVHPTQKPTKLCSWVINKFSEREDIVLDLFGGSGSTLIAAEKLNRKCYMMELAPEYCQVIIDRWENYTGNKAKNCEGAVKNAK
jgi:DNA modification methylase